MATRTENTKSVKALHKLLVEILNKPEEYVENPRLQLALISQGALAGLSLPESDIFSMSLNTFKGACNEVIDGGYATIDACRKSAAILLQSASNLNSSTEPRTKRAIAAKVRLLEEQVALYEKDLFHVSKAFWRALTEMRSMARRSGKAALIEECIETENLLRGMASLTAKPILELVQ